MTPEYNPVEDVTQKEFDLLPVGDAVLIVDDVETKVSQKGTMMYALKLKPYILVGNYGTVFLYFPEASMLHMLLSFCEATGISKHHLFPLELRSDPSLPNSFVDIIPGEAQNLLSRNMLGRVVTGVIKHEKGQDDKKRAVIDINAQPPFKVYMVNGEPCKQPPLLTTHTAGAPLEVAPEQQALTPPDDGIGNPANDIVLPDDD